MTKLERLLKKCMEQNNPNGGTAESFNSSLKDLGRWVLTLHTNGKLILDEESEKSACLKENISFNDYVKEVGELAVSHGYWKGRERTFGELIAACHYDLSKVLEERHTGYHPSYTYYRSDSEPRGIPGEIANVIIRIFVICHYYEIDIETVLKEKIDYKKGKKCWYNKKKI